MAWRIAVAVLAITTAACAPARPAATTSPAQAFEAAVEVDNSARVPVVIKYYRQGGGPYYLGTVGANRSTRLVLPYPDVGHIFAETEGGNRLDQALGTNPVRIRRVEP